MFVWRRASKEFNGLVVSGVATIDASLRPLGIDWMRSFNQLFILISFPAPLSLLAASDRKRFSNGTDRRLILIITYARNVESIAPRWESGPEMSSNIFSFFCWISIQNTALIAIGMGPRLPYSIWNFFFLLQVNFSPVALAMMCAFVFRIK